MANLTPLQAIDAAMLVPLVRRALHNDTVEIADWEGYPLRGGATANVHVYRFVGHGHDQTQTVPWSLVLKVWCGREGRDDPLQWNYWKRAPLAYASGLLDDLPGGLVAPRLLGLVEQADETIWLWLEEMARADQRPWPLINFGRAARHLGRFNGAYLTGRPVPAYPWLSHGWLLAWVVFCTEAIAALESTMKHPLIHQRYPDSAARGLLRLWKERALFLDALDLLPQTFCHRDAFARNLFVLHGVDSRDQTGAIDWANAGVGALGEEPAALVGGSLVFFEIEASAARSLDETAFTGYLEGLRDAGWHGDPRVILLGHATALALRYGLGSALDVQIAADESAHAWAEEVLGHSIRDMLERDATLAGFFLERAEEARQLLGTL